MKRSRRTEAPVADQSEPDTGSPQQGSATVLTQQKSENLTGIAVRGIGWTVLRSLSSRLIGIVVFVLLARLLSPADFGTVALASVFVVLISVLVESGFAEAIVQRKEITPTDLNTAFWVNNAIAIVLALLLIVSADPLATAFHQPQLGPVLQVLSTVFLLAGLTSVPQAILKRQLAFRTIALRGVVAALAGGVVGIGMALAGAGVWSLVGQMIAFALVESVIIWIVCPWRPGRSMSRASLKELLHFSGRILGERLTLFASRRSDDFLIGVVLGPVALGLYAVAYRVILILTETLIWTLESVAFPLLSRLQSHRERKQRAFYGLSQLCFAVAIPAFLLLAALAPEVIRLAFGSRWIAAIPLVQILAMVGIPHAAMYCNKAAINAGGRPDLSLRIGILTCVVTVLGFAVTVRWGILAVATSYAVCTYLLLPVSVWAVVRVHALDLKSYLRLFVAPLISGLVMAGAVLLTKALLGPGANDWIRLSVSLLVALLVYLTMLWLTARAQMKALVPEIRRLRPSKSR